MIANITPEQTEIFFHRDVAALSRQLALHALARWRLHAHASKLLQAAATVASPLEYGSWMDVERALFQLEQNLAPVAELAAAGGAPTDHSRELGRLLQHARWLRALSVSEDEADAERAFLALQWCDRFADLLCRHALERALEHDDGWIDIGLGPDGQKYRCRSEKDDTVSVAPWPFDVLHLRVTVAQRLLPRDAMIDILDIPALLAASTHMRAAWLLLRPREDVASDARPHSSDNAEA